MSVPVSAYERIRRHVMRQIYQRARAGDAGRLEIPSQHELKNMFGVTRRTVQKALAPLLREGYLLGRKGMATYINPARVAAARVLMPRGHAMGVIVSNGKLVHYDYHNQKQLAGALARAADLGVQTVFVSLEMPAVDAAREIMGLQLSALLWINPLPAVHPVIRKLTHAGLPVAVTNAPDALAESARCGIMTCDYNVAAEQGMRLLLRRGCRNVLFLAESDTGATGFGGYYFWRQGGLKALRDHGGQRVQYATISSAAELSRRKRQLDASDAALLWGGGVPVFFEALDKCQSASGRPKQVVALGNTCLTGYQDRLAAVLHIPFAELGAGAVDMLANKLDGNNHMTVRRLPVKLVEL